MLPYTSHTGNAEILERLVLQLHGQQVTKVRLSGKSLVTLLFGIPKTDKTEFRGQFHIGSCASWRIVDEKSVLIGSKDNKKDISNSLSRLTGKLIDHINLNYKTLDIKITFSDNCYIELFSVRKYPPLPNVTCWMLQRFGRFSVVVRPDQIWRFTDLQQLEDGSPVPHGD